MALGQNFRDRISDLASRYADTATNVVFKTAGTGGGVDANGDYTPPSGPVSYNVPAWYDGYEDKEVDGNNILRGDLKVKVPAKDADDVSFDFDAVTSVTFGSDVYSIVFRETRRFNDVVQVYEFQVRK